MVLYSNIHSSISGFSKTFEVSSEGVKTSVNVSTPNYTFNATRNPNGNTSASLKISDVINASRKFKVNSIIKTGDVQEIDVSTDVNPEFSVKVGGVGKKRVTDSAGAVTDNLGANLGLTFNKPNFGFTLDTKYVHETPVAFEASGAGVYRDFVFGGKTSYKTGQPISAAWKNLVLGARGDFGGHSAYVTLTNQKNKTTDIEGYKVSGAVEYRIPNSSDRIVAESEYDLTGTSDNVKLSVGLQKILASGATTGIRLANDYTVGLSYKTKVNSNLTASVAALVDTKESKTSKVGVNLDFTF